MQQNRRVVLASVAADPRRRRPSNQVGMLPGDFRAIDRPFAGLEPDYPVSPNGSDAIFAVRRPDLGMPAIQNGPLPAQAGLAGRKSVEGYRAPQRLTGDRNPKPAVRAPNPARHTEERSTFDLAGRFHDWQAGPKISRPNAFQEMAPVIGPGWDALADLQDGNYGSALFNGALAGLDAVPSGYLLKGIIKSLKVTRELNTILPKAYEVQRKMHELGLASRGDDVHHIFELQHMSADIPKDMRRKVKNWRNNPLFLKVLPRETHRRLHTRYGGKEKFGLGPRLWHGTTDWMKAGAAGVAGDGVDLIENLAIRPDHDRAAPPTQTRPGGLFPSPYIALLP